MSLISMFIELRIDPKNRDIVVAAAARCTAHTAAVIIMIGI